MLVGYARVSTGDQSLDLQLDALERAGCEKVFRDVATGGLDSRKGLSEALEYVRDGDTLVVWRLDRLGRSLKHLIETVAGLCSRGIGFKSVQEQIDTTTPGGKLVFHVFGALAEFEREIIRDRTRAGLQAARQRGRRGGRPAKMDEKKIAMARKLLGEPDTSVADVCQALRASHTARRRSDAAALRLQHAQASPEERDADSHPRAAGAARLAQFVRRSHEGTRRRFDREGEALRRRG